MTPPHFFRYFLRLVILLSLLTLAACGGSQPEAQPRPQVNPTEAGNQKVYLPLSAGDPSGQPAPADAQTSVTVAISSTAETVNVDGTFTVTVVVSGAKQPYFYVLVQDTGAAEGVVAAQIKYSGEATMMEGISGVVDVVSARPFGDQVIIRLKAKAEGAATLWVRVVDADQKNGSSQPIGIAVSK